MILISERKRWRRRWKRRRRNLCFLLMQILRSQIIHRHIFHAIDGGVCRFIVLAISWKNVYFICTWPIKPSLHLHSIIFFSISFCLFLLSLFLLLFVQERSQFRWDLVLFQLFEILWLIFFETYSNLPFRRLTLSLFLL